MKSNRNPQIGDKIEHTSQLSETYAGTVVQLLSEQFVYEVEKNHTRFCLFKENWRYINDWGFLGLNHPHENY